jgi:hypothetical protein
MPPGKTFRVVEKNLAETIGGEFSYAQKSSALLKWAGDIFLSGRGRELGRV